MAEDSNVTLYANEIVIGTKSISLAAGASMNITLNWNTTGSAKGYYTLSAYAFPVFGETFTIDNLFSEGSVFVSIAGDVTGVPSGVPDWKVDMRDIGLRCSNFGARPGNPRWIEVTCRNCDINDDGTVNMQ